jgi:hypothetical protein
MAKYTAAPMAPHFAADSTARIDPPLGQHQEADVEGAEQQEKQRKRHDEEFYRNGAAAISNEASQVSPTP